MQNDKTATSQFSSLTGKQAKLLKQKNPRFFELEPVSLLLTLSLTLSRITTFPTGRFLQMVRLGPTSTTQGVRLISSLTKR